MSGRAAHAMIDVLRRHTSLPDWAELGVKVPEARAIVALIDGLTEQLAEANRTINGLKGSRPTPVDRRVPHSHVCITCSPDGAAQGPGCHNCRNTGMDQTPCTAPGHRAHCPAGCCDQESPARLRDECPYCMTGLEDQCPWHQSSGGDDRG